MLRKIDIYVAGARRRESIAGGAALYPETEPTMRAAIAVSPRLWAAQ